MVGSDEISFCKSPFAGDFCKKNRRVRKTNMAGWKVDPKWVDVFSIGKWGDFPAIRHVSELRGGVSLCWSFVKARVEEPEAANEGKDEVEESEEEEEEERLKFEVSSQLFVAAEGWKKIYVLLRESCF